MPGNITFHIIAKKYVSLPDNQADHWPGQKLSCIYTFIGIQILNSSSFTTVASTVADVHNLTGSIHGRL